jgi:hypothetical protein
MLFPKPKKKPKKKPKPLKRTPVKKKRATPRRTKRIVDQEVLEFFRSSPCEACGRPPRSDPAHIRSRGAGGDDTYENIISLCRLDHCRQHKIGWVKFSKLNYSVERALRLRGWEIVNNKLVRR